MKSLPHFERRRTAETRPPLLRIAVALAVLGFAIAGPAPAQETAPAVPPETKPAQEKVQPKADPKPTLDQTRLTMGKWIETQQIISKEKKDWVQGKEILVGRLDIVKQEIAALEEKIKLAESEAAAAQKKKEAALAETEQLKATGARLVTAVAALETEVKKIFTRMPDPIQTKVKVYRERMPEDSAQTRVSIAERFQNVLGILNEVNKANTEIAVNFEVKTLSNGKPAEVKTLYVGLAQAYFVAPTGEAGIGRPGDDGWKWEPNNAVSADVVMALEIIQGKHSPAFVPLPVRIQ